MSSMIELTDLAVAVQDSRVLRSATEQPAHSTQYTPVQILALWASVALPVGFIHGVLLPILISRVEVNPGLLYLNVIVVGMLWQAVAAAVVLRREVKPFTWENIKERLWLHIPSDPNTRARSKWLYLWTIPLIAINTAGPMLVGGLNDAWVKALPVIAPPPYTIIQYMAKPAVSQW